MEVDSLIVSLLSLFEYLTSFISAQISVIGMDLVKALGIVEVSPWPHSAQILCLGKASHSPTGIVHLTFQFSESHTMISHPFAVFPSLSSGLLLGNDFLRQYVSALDFLNGTLIFHGGEAVNLVEKRRIKY